jgi:thiamine biosynthesis lipoprotein
VEYHERFRAMDTDIDLFIEAESTPGPAVFLGARLLFEQQEARFSRFRETSLLSALNRGEEVSNAWLARAVSMALEAFGLTGGLFNPMVLPSLSQAGYDRTFKEVSGGAPRPARVPLPSEAIVIDGDAVRLREGALDLGGIVKGWSGDLAAQELGRFSGNAFVNAGGDIRCLGSDGAGAGWEMDLASTSGAQVWAGRLAGGIATSTTSKRRWATASGGTAHHLIDPRTGMPAQTPFVQATARAESCWLAEVWAKAVVIGGAEGLERAQAAGIPVIAETTSGELERRGSW